MSAKNRAVPFTALRRSHAPVQARCAQGGSMTGRAACLARIPLFAALTEAELMELAEACCPRTFKPGEVLVHEGDPGTVLYAIQSGVVKIVRIAPDGAEPILDVQAVGDCLGMMSLVDGGPRSATVVALEKVEALVLYRDHFIDLIARRPAVALALMQELTQMVRRLSEQVQDGMLLDVPARLAKKLLELAEQYGQETPHGIRIGLRLTQEDLGQMVGAVRPTVSRQLGWFQERGLLTLERCEITLHAPEELRKRIY